jgi:hypothetical protein
MMINQSLQIIHTSDLCMSYGGMVFVCVINTGKSEPVYKNRHHNHPKGLEKTREA